jgi:hypothetical protein
MKRLVSLFMVGSLIVACNNSADTSTTSTDSGTAPNSTNVENVNGNIPDSASGMTLNQSLPVDSSKLKDSGKH